MSRSHCHALNSVTRLLLIWLALAGIRAARAQEPFTAQAHSWLQADLPTCLSRAARVMGSAGFTVNSQSFYVQGRRSGLEAFIHCHQHPSGPMALTVTVAGCGNQGQNQARDYLRDQMLNPTATAAPAPPAAGGGAQCNATTLTPRASGVYFPQTGQPAGWDYSGLRASSAAECCQKCQNARFPCKSFIFNSDPRNNVCNLLNMDTCSADPARRLVLKPDRGNPQAQYFEVTGCATNASGGPAASGTSAGAGVCSDARTLPVMDEWLSRAIPPQKPGENLRYEPWGRQVGSSATATIRPSGPPDTPLSRCEWLWQYSATLRSANGLGTLQDYVRQRLR